MGDFTAMFSCSWRPGSLFLSRVLNWIVSFPSNRRIVAALVVFIYLGFYVAFNTVQVISRRVVGRAEETSTYSWLGLCTVNCRPTASNCQLSHLRPSRGLNPRPQRWEARVLPLCHRGPFIYSKKKIEFCGRFYYGKLHFTPGGVGGVMLLLHLPRSIYILLWFLFSSEPFAPTDIWYNEEENTSDLTFHWSYPRGAEE